MVSIAADGEHEDRKYVGSAWRSRFLRSPKIALELGSREDFAAIEDLADVKLGLKTGADDYFFLQRATNPPEPGHSRLIPSRGTILVEGKDGWVGHLAQADLRPAVLNPHEFIAASRKRFVIRKDSRWFYLMPAQDKMRGDLPGYIKLGEMAHLPEKALVKSNSSVDAWYRQTRSLLSSPWVLPYNSAYDYGAWENAVGAVLNGRFVGATARPGVDSDMLGAVLNSTFAVVGRLTEGVATGVEGAFDVGPPAVRRIRVPDIRRFSSEGASAIAAILDEIRASDEMPPAPNSDGNVPRIRRRLDVAVLMALGATGGQAAALLERVYTSYGRWRGHIQNVEDQVQKNRRDLSRSGRSRTTRPEESIGRRIWEELKEEFELFPGRLLLETEPCEAVLVPPGAVIPETHPLLEPGVILGTGRRRIDLHSYARVQYVQMLREIGVTGLLSVPNSPELAHAIVLAFQRAKSKLQKTALERSSSHFGTTKSALEAAKTTEKMWLSACRATISQGLTDEAGA